MKEALLYWNPLAGRRPVREDRVERFRHDLRSLRIESTLHTAPFQSQEEAACLLKGKDLLLIWGGDGSLHDLLGAVVRSGVPVALVPTGTVNVLALELGLPRTEQELLPTLERPRWKEISIAKAGGEYFHLMTGAGFDAYLLSRIGRRLKRTLGVAAYWGVGLTSFFKYPLEPFTVISDTGRFEATFAVVSNVRHYGGQFLMAPQADPEKAELDVCIFKSKHHLRYFYYLWKVWRGRHIKMPDVIYHKARHVVLEGGGHISYQLDGEVRGGLPLEIEATDEKVKILVNSKRNPQLATKGVD